MVSRRNFFSIVVMMAVLLFMFQFSQVIKENESDYHINVYAMEEIVPNAPIWRAESQEGNAPGHRDMGGEVEFAAADGAYAAFFGSKKGKVYPVVEQYRNYGSIAGHVFIEVVCRIIFHDASRCGGNVGDYGTI